MKVVSSLENAVPIGVSVRPGRRADLAREGFAIARDMTAAARLGARVAIIATDTRRHLQDSLEALDLGMDLLVEKPLTVNSQEAAQLLKHSQKLGRKLFVGCVLRFSESLNSFKQQLPKIGDAQSVEVESRSYLPDWRPSRDYRYSYSASSTEGGVLRDLIHEIDYTTWIFGWPKLVSANLRNLGQLGIDAEEIADLNWTTPSGALTSVHLDYLSQTSIRFMKVLGDRGTITWDGTKNTVQLKNSNMKEKNVTIAQSRDDMFQSQTQAFLAAVEHANDDQLATGEDGYKALALCDAARLASSLDCPQEIKYFQTHSGYHDEQ